MLIQLSIQELRDARMSVEHEANRVLMCRGYPFDEGEYERRQRLLELGRRLLQIEVDEVMKQPALSRA